MGDRFGACMLTCTRYRVQNSEPSYFSSAVKMFGERPRQPNTFVHFVGKLSLSASRVPCSSPNILTVHEEKPFIPGERGKMNARTKGDTMNCSGVNRSLYNISTPACESSQPLRCLHGSVCNCRRVYSMWRQQFDRAKVYMSRLETFACTRTYYVNSWIHSHERLGFVSVTFHKRTHTRVKRLRRNGLNASAKKTSNSRMNGWHCRHGRGRRMKVVLVVCCVYRRQPNILNTHDIAIQKRVHILLDSLRFVYWEHRKFGKLYIVVFSVCSVCATVAMTSNTALKMWRKRIKYRFRWLKHAMSRIAYVWRVCVCVWSAWEIAEQFEMTKTTTTMQIRNNSERANWQFRHKFTTERILNLLVFAMNIWTCVRNASRSCFDESTGDEKPHRQFEYRRMCRIVSEVLYKLTNEMWNEKAQRRASQS